jgi:hypothetical protein
MLRVFEDHEDRLSTVIQINLLANRRAGVLVGHAPPRGCAATLPQDLLLALGHDASAHDWPTTAQRAWALARAWMAGLEIQHLIVYGAWRLDTRTAATLRDIADADAICVSVVTLSALTANLPRSLAQLDARPVADLIAGTVPASGRRSEPPNPRILAELPDRLPQLPAADFMCFLSECVGCIEDADHRHALILAFDRTVDRIHRELGGAKKAQELLDVLESVVREARDANELLVGVRSFQVAALQSGWHVRIALRDIHLAVATALDTAPTNHQHWPMPTWVHPRLQALAAAAWATGWTAQTLASATIADVSPSCTALAKSPIDPAMAPPIRAQTWLQLHQGRSDSDALFTAANGRALRAHGVRAALDNTAPTAFNAACGGSSALRRSLAQHADIHRITGEPPNHDTRHARSPLLPSAEYWDWTFANGADEFHAQTGLPNAHSQDPMVPIGRGYHLALDKAAGFTDPRSCSTADGEQAASPRALHRADAARLHAVLLLCGGGADRLSLIRGLDWSAEQLDAAQRRLRQTLEGTAEVLAATLDGRLELRVRHDGATDRAVDAIQRRADCDDGLPPTAAWLVSALLRGPASGLKIDELPLPPGLAMTAIGELRQRRMLEVHYQGRIRLSDRVRANLSAAGGHTIIPTSCCR